MLSQIKSPHREAGASFRTLVFSQLSQQLVFTELNVHYCCHTTK